MDRLFWKSLIMIWLSFVLLAILIVSHFYQLDLERKQLTRESAVENVLEEILCTSELIVQRSTMLEIPLEVLQQQKYLPSWASVYILDNHGIELLGRRLPPSAQQITPARFNNKRNSTAIPQPTINSPPLVSVDKHTTSKDAQPVLLIATAQLQPLTHTPLSTFLTNQSLYLLPAIFITLLLSALLSWLLTKPVRNIDGALHILSQNKLLKHDMASSRAFDNSESLAHSIKELIHSHRMLLHDVSHELRSPLARLQVSLGLAQQQPERVPHCLERIEVETQRLESLVNEVLTLSQIESGLSAETSAYQYYKEKIDIIELIDTVMDTARFEAKSQGCHIDDVFDVDDSPFVEGYGELLYRALENVLRNAIHHTEKGSTVTLTLRYLKSHKFVEIQVEDEGPGVALAHVDKIFDPFFRSQPSEYAYRGFGLGLTIAQRAIQSHAGSIKAQNRVEKGLSVEIRLPTVSSDNINPDPGRRLILN